MKAILILGLWTVVCSSYAFEGTLKFNFKATTNVPGVSVEGKLLEPLPFKVESGKSLVIPLSKLSTDMDLRDEHMRSEIFGNKDALVHFTDAAVCTGESCQVKLDLEINGVKHSLNLTAKQKDQSYAGDTQLLLSDFKIKAPAKFGVEVENQMVVNYEVQAKTK